MLRRWSVSNFKSIGALAEVEFLDLTVLVGSNSSGKSSLIQSVLVVAQSFRSRAAPSRPLIWNGDLVRLGTAPDVLHLPADPDQPGISLGFTLELAGGRELEGASGRRVVDIGATLVPEAASSSSATPADMAVASSVLELKEPTTGRRRPRIAVERRPGHTKLWRLAAANPQGAGALPALEYEIKLSGAMTASDPWSVLLGQEWAPAGGPIAAEFDRFIPSALIVASQPERQRLDRLEHLALIRQSGKARNLSGPLLESVIGIQLDQMAPESGLKEIADQIRKGRNLKSAIERIHEEQRRLASPHMPQRLNLPEPIGVIARDTRHALAEGIRYLGPLRDDPRAVYPLPATSSIGDVGVKGQFTAAVLHANASQSVRYVDVMQPEPREVETTLHQGVQYWLRQMNLLEDVATAEAGKLGYTVTVQAVDTKTFVDLTSVGVGVSQVLPILVQALLAPPDTLLIFEQPELHLQPAVQSSLADFLLAIALSGRRVLVETHSDHFVTRLRRRVAEGRASRPGSQPQRRSPTKANESVRLYFVTRVGGSSIFRKMAINSGGAFSEWPIGFLDHEAREAEALLSASIGRAEG